MPLVDLPNQFSDLIKLRRILQTIDRLLKSNKGIDDESLGYTLFLEGTIKQRKKSNLPVNEQLENIKKKPKSYQSPLTTARATRQFFLQLGFLEEHGYTFKITERGKKVTDTPSEAPLGEEEKNAWIEGFQNLTLQQKDGTDFHPLHVMLSLIGDKTLETKLLAFAFTVNDDSDDELKRVKETVNRINSGKSTWTQELQDVEITESNARNSVKILPSILEQLGIIKRSRGFASLTEKGKTLPKTSFSTPKTLSRLEEWFSPPVDYEEKPSTPTTERKAPFFKEIVNEEELKRNWKMEDVEQSKVQYDPKDDEERFSILRERTDEHQETLVKLQRMFQDKNWRMGIGNFDLLLEKGNNALLNEIKTIKIGDVSDERLRIIDGVGKLFFYESFDVPPLLHNKSATIQKIMVFSKKPNSQEHVDFLKKLNIWSIWFDGDNLNGEEEALNLLKKLIS